MRYLAITLLVISALAATTVATEIGEQPATILIVGRIWTADSHRPFAEAVAVRDEKIVAVGTREELERFHGKNTQVIDAGAGMVVPGLIDSHIHLIDGGLQLASVQLRDAKTREEFVRRIGEFAKKKAKGSGLRAAIGIIRCGVANCRRAIGSTP